ncbi:MAG: GxxExxY protein [Armatimonadetes bacterium]|nr:GxxExxY protein [Armatimonadota bacterium]
MKLNEITEIIIGAAIEVHRALGPGLLESAYAACLAYESTTRGLKVGRQLQLPVTYKGVHLDCGYRVDLLVEDQVVVELKVVDRFDPIHDAQLLTYLKLSGCQVGLLLNFNAAVLRDGIKRLVHNCERPGRPSAFHRQRTENRADRTRGSANRSMHDSGGYTAQGCQITLRSVSERSGGTTTIL